jgi:hypothetical protein
MAAKPKLPPEVWETVRSSWEGNESPGYQWVVDLLQLPVTSQSVRKRALREGWSKVPPSMVTGGNGSSQKPLPPLPTPSLGLEKLAPQIAEKLTTKQRLFVEEYGKDACASQAAVRAGYSPASAEQQGSRLLRNEKVAQAVEIIQCDRLNRMSAEADAIVSHLFAVANADPGEITQYRRVNCRHCWGTNFEYQRTPAEFRAHEKAWKLAALKAKKAGHPQPEFDEEGGLGFDRTRSPNPECPECHGQGVGDVFITDTRTLSPAARLLFDGVEQTRDGLKVNMQSRERAREQLARIAGLYSQSRENETAPEEIDVDALEERYVRTLEEAHKRQAALMEERRLWIEGLTDNA